MYLKHNDGPVNKTGLFVSNEMFSFGEQRLGALGKNIYFLKGDYCFG
jgi:hypothetical protein